MNTQVGVVCGASTGTVYAVINPDDDNELDNPRWLLIKTQIELREPLTLIKLGLAEYMAFTHPDQIEMAVKRRLGL